MGGWGLIPWGLGPWGGFDSSMSVVGAFAAGDRFVRVTLSASPLQKTSTTPGDVLNPRTWRVTVPGSGRTLTVLSVQPVSAKVFDILTLEQFDSHLASMRVAAPTLRAASGALAPPAAVDFLGAKLEATSTAQKVATRRGFALRDLHNPPTPNSPTGGTLEITSSGDYATVEGPAFVKKMIIRRIFTMTGEFFHLPNYGAGVREKMTLSTADLPRLKKLLQDQIALEPEVDTVAVSLLMQPAKGLLFVTVNAKLKHTGQMVDVSVPLALPTVQL